MIINDKKEEFLNNISTNKKNYETLFNIAKDYEDRYSCDLACFNKKDFFDLFIEKEWLSFNTFNTRKNMIKNYMLWYYDNDIKKIINISDIKFQQICKNTMYENSYFKSFNELYKYTQLYLDSTESNDREQHEVTVCLIFLLWLDLKIEEILGLKVDDFNYLNYSIVYGKDKKMIKIPYQEVCDALNKLSNQAVRKGYYKLFHSTIINKEYKSINTINKKIMDFNKIRDEKKFIPNNIKKSGLYTRIYQIQKKHNLSNSSKDIDKIFNILQKDKSDRVKCDYDEWIKWRKDTDESILRNEIDNIISVMNNAKDYISQKDYWSLVKTRIGQGNFRDILIRKYRCKCMLCEITNKEVLIASHIKEFTLCDPDERYDINNGLLLCANHDKLFDKHLISFDSDGNIMISPCLNKSKIRCMNLHENIKINPDTFDEKYMKCHRNKLQSTVEAFD